MWPFKRKANPALPNLVYKSGEAFFRLQCKYGHTEIKEGNGIVAIVLDSMQEFGTSVPVKIQPSGNQLAAIKVASEDGGFVTLAETLSAAGDRLKPGDLVVWVPEAYLPEMAEQVRDPRGGWVGLIVAKVAAESDPNTNELKVLCQY